MNKAILIGHLGADPETKSTGQGTTICNLRLATSEKWTDKQGQKHEATEWHRVVLFGKTAEIAAQYLAKGRQVYIEGRIRTRKWQDKSGADRYSTEIVGDKLVFLGGGGSEKRQDARPERDEFEGLDAGAQFPDDDIPF